MARWVGVHLLPFFPNTALEDITAGKVQEYRVHRQTSRLDPKTGKPKKPARATLHGEIVTLRQVLKTANRKGWIAAPPDMSAPYKTSAKSSIARGSRLRNTRRHLKNNIDASAVNVRRARPQPPAVEKKGRKTAK